VPPVNADDFKRLSAADFKGFQSANPPAATSPTGKRTRTAAA
jgi:hypothetical protein